MYMFFITPLHISMDYDKQNCRRLCVTDLRSVTKLPKAMCNLSALLTGCKIVEDYVRGQLC